MSTPTKMKMTTIQARILMIMAKGRTGWTWGGQARTNAIMRALTVKGLVDETPVLGENFGKFAINDAGFATAVIYAVENNVNFRIL